MLPKMSLLHFSHPRNCPRLETNASFSRPLAARDKTNGSKLIKYRPAVKSKQARLSGVGTKRRNWSTGSKMKFSTLVGGQRVCLHNYLRWRVRHSWQLFKSPVEGAGGTEMERRQQNRIDGFMCGPVFETICMIITLFSVKSK